MSHPSSSMAIASKAASTPRPVDFFSPHHHPRQTTASQSHNSPPIMDTPKSTFHTAYTSLGPPENVSTPIAGNLRVQQTGSPSYFGLAIEPKDHVQHSHGNWSPPNLSIRSTAASSPKPFTATPVGSYDQFRKQTEAYANNQTHNVIPTSTPSASWASNEQERRTSDGQLDVVEVASAHTNQLGTPRIQTPRQRNAHAAPTSALQKPHTPIYTPKRDLQDNNGGFGFFGEANKMAYPPTAASNERLNVVARDHFSRLSLPGSPFRPQTNVGPSSSRSNTLPSNLKSDSVSLITPDSLVGLLQVLDPNILILDVRTFNQYKVARIRSALNVCIPTTLLKRPTFNVQKLVDTFSNKDDRSTFEKWKRAHSIIVYDAETDQLRDALAANQLAAKFVREGWQGSAYCLQGGFNAFARTHPELVDRKAPSGENSPTLSLHGNSGQLQVPGGIAFNCPIPTSKNAANPFFSNIRQNQDLIGGVGEIPITVPSHLNNAQKKTLPEWIRKLALKESGTKDVSNHFLKIEIDEQKRMQDALSSGQVVVGNQQLSPTSEAPPELSRRDYVPQLAGIEKGTKNRYNSIWPYDHARVKLVEFDAAGGQCDYVNASHVSASRSRKTYIATQGPLPTTFNDFWSVVWDQDVRVIVMLTAESEGGQLKCHNYWASKKYGNYKLNQLAEHRVSLDPAVVAQQRRHSSGTSLASTPSSAPPTPNHPNGAFFQTAESNSPFAIVRNFTLMNTSQPFEPMREITQIHYSSWPDFGAPAHPAHILGLIQQTQAVTKSLRTPRSSFSGSSAAALLSVPEKPILVHCSAGCGRTGTFCTIDSVIDMMQEQIAYRITHQSQLKDVEGDSAMFNPESPNWLLRDDVDLVLKAVEDFRGQRLSMVQSLRQYVLCYDTILEWWGRQGSKTWVPAPHSPHISMS